MSTIKNGRELVLRAQGHARVDHIQQGTYGESSCNGYVEFKGCAIGCLATPHRQSELRGFIKSLGRFFADDGDGDQWVLSESASDQLKRLKRDFGINIALARCAEALFEAMPTHGAAINFIPAFAKAVAKCEGVNLTPGRVARGWRESVVDGYCSRASYWGAITGDWDVGFDSDAEEAAKSFLGWIEAQAA